MTTATELANRYTPTQLAHLVAELHRNPVHRQPDGALKPGAARRLYRLRLAQARQQRNRRLAS